MKTIIFLALLVSTSFSFAGQDRGGGNVVHADPISIDALESMIGPSRMELLLYFNYLDIAAINPGISVNNLIMQVRHFKIFSNNKGPCIDKDGRATDASIYPHNGDGVCISTFNLSRKLFKDNAQIQFIALLAHEYAHLAGADETKARELQKLVLSDLAVLPPLVAQGFMTDYYSLILKLRQDVNALLFRLESAAPDTYCSLAREFEREISNLSINTYETLSLVDRKGHRQERRVWSTSWDFRNEACNAGDLNIMKNKLQLLSTQLDRLLDLSIKELKRTQTND